MVSILNTVLMLIAMDGLKHEYSANVDSMIAIALEGPKLECSANVDCHGGIQA